jgi:hypothetical protein
MKIIFELKQAIKKTIIFELVVIFRRWIRGYGDLKSRVTANIYEYSPAHDVIKSLAIKHGITVFVETGTFIGNTLMGLKDSFKQLFSIELDRGIYKLAKERLKNFEHIQIFYGDSSKVLPEILRDLKTPALFWLDAHYSSGVTAKGELQTPIMRELKAIFTHSNKQHCILIDDVKDFNGLNDYPTADEILNFISKYGNGLYIGRVEGQVFVVEPS